MENKNKQLNLNLQIEIFTQIPLKRRKELIYWFARQCPKVQNEIFIDQRNQFFKLKQMNKASDVVALSAFLLAIEKFYKLGSKLNSKNKSSSLCFPSKKKRNRFNW